MMQRSLFLLAAVIGFGVILQPHKAEAAAIGQSCAKLGSTEVANDQQNMAACLYDQSHSLVWKQITGTPQLIGGDQGKPVARFENGGVVWNEPAPKSEAAAPSPRALLATAPAPWQGWYIGANAGGGIGHGATQDMDCYYCATEGFTEGFGEAGGQVGYNWLHGSTVLGLVADANWASFDHRGDIGIEFGQPGKTGMTLDGFASIRARAGLVADDTLFYMDAGPALGHVHAFANELTAQGSGTLLNKADSDSFRLGLAAGGGVEFMMDSHWSIGGEYMFLDLLDRRQSIVPINGGGFNCSTPCRINFPFSAQMARVGVNYHFN